MRRFTDAALAPGAGPGWRAAQAGEQTIQLLFEEPHRVRRIQLVFEDDQPGKAHSTAIRGGSAGTHAGVRAPHASLAQLRIA